jgi:hypothetical protein
LSRNKRRKKKKKKEQTNGLVDGLLLKVKVVGEVATLVVASQQPKVFGAHNLPCVQQQHGLASKLAPVAVVSQEGVVHAHGVPRHLEQLQQVVKPEREEKKNN